MTEELGQAKELLWRWVYASTRVRPREDLSRFSEADWVSICQDTMKFLREES